MADGGATLVEVEVASIDDAESSDGDAVQEEGMEEPMAVLGRTISSHFSSMRDEINVLHQEMTSRDILLEKLEESVTRLVEDLNVNFTPLKEYVMAKMREETGAGSSQSLASSEGSQDGDAENEEQANNVVRDRCIEAMMGVTEILEENEERTTQVRVLYERIYDASPLTSLILTFLESHPRKVKVLIDCNSRNINRLVKRFIDHDGEKRAGTALQSFVDFFGCKAYVGGFAGIYNEWVSNRQVSKTADPVSSLAQCLAQLAIYIIFDNRGCPYVCDDDLHEKLYEKILAEALQKKSTSTFMDDILQGALNCKTPFGREVSLISVVPGILVKYGLKEGMSRLYELLPLLPLFYMQHVLPKMMNNSRV